MAMHQKQPKTLYAGLWDFRRTGWNFPLRRQGRGGKRQRALQNSTDGARWLDEAGCPDAAKGLPARPWGRVAVAVAPSKPNVVYAFIEAVPPKNGLYRSDNGGQTWEAADRESKHGLAAFLLSPT